MGRRAQRETSAGGVVFRRGEGGGGPQYLLIFDQHGNWGFPKGHVESGEQPVDAGRREVREEAGLDGLVQHASLGTIHWFFQHRGRLIHKYCHFFLFESPAGTPLPQTEEGITACGWYPGDQALATLTHQNAREVLVGAIERVQALCADPGRRA